MHKKFKYDTFCILQDNFKYKNLYHKLIFYSYSHFLAQILVNIFRLKCNGEKFYYLISLLHIYLFKFRRLDSTNFHVKLYFAASFHPFKCSISYTMQRRTEQSKKERKCEARLVGLLSSRREAHFYLPRNKDKSETRTNQRYP